MYHRARAKSRCFLLLSSRGVVAVLLLRLSGDKQARINGRKPDIARAGRPRTNDLPERRIRGVVLLRREGERERERNPISNFILMWCVCVCVCNVSSCRTNNIFEGNDASGEKNRLSRSHPFFFFLFMFFFVYCKRAPRIKNGRHRRR